MAVQSFRAQVPQAQLEDLRDRLARTRWPDEVEGAGWDYGTNRGYLKSLAEYWADGFDWRKQEEQINRFPNYRGVIDGLGIHFIWEKGKGRNNLPLLLLHGWPGSFLQMAKIIPLLSDPERYGGRPEDSFDVVAASLPGYGFSDRPRAKGVTIQRMAELLFQLMTRELGYGKFAVRGSDIGAGVAREMALAHPDTLVGLHLSGSSPYIPFVPTDLSEAEQKYLRDSRRYVMQEGAYAMEQATKPQTLAYGLNDSPVGLAAWIVEKFRSWSDCGGDVEQRFTKDELLANITLYWLTETMASSVRVYYETGRMVRKDFGSRVMVPTAMAMFPRDLMTAPREWEERFYRIIRWTPMPRGGHFPEMEEPGLLVGDIRRSAALWYLAVGR